MVSKTEMDYLRVIKLGYGEGKPGERACWMTALQAHMGGKWTDRLAIKEYEKRGKTPNESMQRALDLIRKNKTKKGDDV